MKINFMMKFSLLSISLILTATTSISSTIPLMQETFKDCPLALVEMVTMVPSLTCLVFVLLSGTISEKIGSKQTVILGLFISAVCGSIPMYVNYFSIILLSRMGLGIGLGLFNSLAISLISDFFTGDERTKLIGFQSAFQGLGGAMLTYFAGQLLNINWHMSFSIYLVAVPILILFTLFVPQPKEKKDTKVKHQKVNIRIWKYVMLLFIAMIVYNAIYLKLPTLLIEKGMGTAVDASLLLSVAQIGGMVAGFIFGYLYKRVKQNIVIYALVLMSISFLLSAFTNTLAIIGLCTLLTGISFSLFVPYIFNRVAEISSSAAQTTATSLLIVGAQLAALISPYCLQMLGKIPLLASQVSQVFLSSGLVYFFLIIVIVIYRKRQMS